MENLRSYATIGGDLTFAFQVAAARQRAAAWATREAAGTLERE
jgi:hypothetical protein